MVLEVKNPSANAGDAGNSSSIPGSERSPAGGHGNPLQYACLENPMDRGAWWDTVHSIAKELDMTEATQHAHTCPTFPAPFGEETFPILHSCLLAKD